MLVTWIDFKDYEWGVFSRLSGDGGKGFAAQVRVTGDSADQEQLADSPDPALSAAGKPLIAWTDWRKRDSAATKPHSEYDTFIASPGGRTARSTRTAAARCRRSAPSICTVGRAGALVAFQDASAGAKRRAGGGMRGGALKRGRARLVSDAGARRQRLAAAHRVLGRSRGGCVGGRARRAAAALLLDRCRPEALVACGRSRMPDPDPPRSKQLFPAFRAGTTC